MQPQFMPVPFYEDTIVLVGRDNEPYVAMKPIVENMGLSLGTQRPKVSDRFGSGAVEMIATGSDGKQYGMTCLHSMQHICQTEMNFFNLLFLNNKHQGATA